jgi:hypothetical protein
MQVNQLDIEVDFTNRTEAELSKFSSRSRYRSKTRTANYERLLLYPTITSSWLSAELVYPENHLYLTEVESLFDGDDVTVVWM